MNKKLKDQNYLQISTGQFLIRLITVCMFCAFALTLYFIGTINFACVLLILFGALWNFFIPINSYLSFIFCIVVCVMYSLFAINEGLYINAVLYFFVYVVLQFLIWVVFSDTNMRISEKQLSKRSSIITFCYLFVCLIINFFVAIIWGKNLLAFFDALAASMLALSAFLQSFKYREFFIIRPLALVLAIILWLLAGFSGGFDGVTIAILILYTMYLILDLVFIGYRVYDIVFYKDKPKAVKKDEEKIRNKKATLKKIAENVSDDEDYKGNIKA